MRATLCGRAAIRVAEIPWKGVTTHCAARLWVSETLGWQSSCIARRRNRRRIEGRMKQRKVSFPEGTSSGQRSGSTEADRLTSMLAGGFDQKPIWSGLYESLSDAIFPPKLPPLELTSTPVPTPDRMAARTNPWAIGTATIAAAIGAGGLGVFIFRGIASVDKVQILAGAIPAALLAIAADAFLGWIEKRCSAI